jgi:hypothetical protein
VPGLTGRHEDDLLKIESRSDLTGGHEMSDVDRIKGAAHDADSSGHMDVLGGDRTGET